MNSSLASPPVGAQAPAQDPRFAVPRNLHGITIGEFAKQRIPSLRPTALHIMPEERSLPYTWISDMPIPAFLEHCRSWHLQKADCGGLNTVVRISKALAEYKIIWG